jgi:sulfoxide reductase heme-binding subunit YedZ
MTRSRFVTHIGLAALTVAAYWLTGVYVPHAAPDYKLTVGMGYLSLLLIGVTLCIGPLNLWLQQRRHHNPVNIMLRRDTGIWAGITGLVHVVFGLMINARGDILSNFRRWTEDGYEILVNRRGLSNWIGLVATVVLLGLLLTSNTLMLRRLRGPRWKLLQRSNYVLVTLVLIHTVVYQDISRREAPFGTAVIVGTFVVLGIQALGLILVRLR